MVSCPADNNSTATQLLTEHRVSFVFSLQNWLGETEDQKSSSSTPAYMSVFMSCALSTPAFFRVIID